MSFLFDHTDGGVGMLTVRQAFRIRQGIDEAEGGSLTRRPGRAINSVRWVPSARCFMLLAQVAVLKVLSVEAADSQSLWSVMLGASG